MDTQRQTTNAHQQQAINDGQFTQSAIGQPAQEEMDTVMDTQPPASNAHQQQAINDGQKNINGALCYVDWYVIEAFEALRDALANKNVLSQQELEPVNEAFDKAYYTSGKVAEIDPPGCGSNFAKKSTS